MDFLRRLFGGGEARTTDSALHLYVRCSRCGTPVHVRVHLQNELVPEYGDDLVEGYRLTKEMMDARCFRLMRAEITFDQRKRETSRTIEGGEYISREEYERLTHAKGDERLP
jgi:hypothetical protein